MLSCKGPTLAWSPCLIPRSFRSQPHLSSDHPLSLAMAKDAHNRRAQVGKVQGKSILYP